MTQIHNTSKNCDLMNTWKNWNRFFSMSLYQDIYEHLTAVLIKLVMTCTNKLITSEANMTSLALTY